VKKKSQFWKTFAAPGWIALLTAIGLFAALLGDGAWDFLSWLGLGIPAVLSVRGLLGVRRDCSLRAICGSEFIRDAICQPPQMLNVLASRE